LSDLQTIYHRCANGPNNGVCREADDVLCPALYGIDVTELGSCPTEPPTPFPTPEVCFFSVVFVRFCLRIKQPTPEVETNTPVYATSSIPVPAPTGPITVDVGNVTPSFDKPNRGTIKLPDGKIWCLSFFFRLLL
jgi:hypothetical protein